MIKPDIIKNEMRYNRKLSDYVNDYAEEHECTIDEALKSCPVQSQYKVLAGI